MERRAFLVLGAAVVGLAGCTRQEVEPSPPGEPTPSTAPADPDSQLRDEVAASEVALIAAYRVSIAAHPELAVDLEPLLAHHEEHVARIAPEFEVAPGSPSPSPSESRAPAESAGPAESAATDSQSESPTGDRPAADVLADLAAAESEAQAQRASACNGAQDPALARDLCLIAASEAQHAAVLAGLAAQEPGS